MRARGFALVEMVVGSVMMVTILLAVMQTVSSSARAARVTTSQSSVMMKLNRALATIRRDLTYSGLSTCRAVPPGESNDGPVADGVTYDNFRSAPVINVTAAGIQYGPSVMLSLAPEPGEPIDGNDSDGDGLVDEQQLVRTDAAGAVVLLGGVTAMAFTKNEDVISIAITAAAPGEGRSFTHRVNAVVRMVNN
ncbi:MAG: hypothetical protein U1E76_26100 [Planctomycetota bacterium]